MLDVLVSDLTPPLGKTIHECLRWAFEWEPMDHKTRFVASESPYFTGFLQLLEQGAQITPDTPFDNGQPLLESVSWDSYCLWNDDTVDNTAVEQYDKMVYAVLAELVQRGFRFPRGEEDLAEFRGSEGFHIQELVALVAKNEADRLEQTLPASTAPSSRPRM